MKFAATVYQKLKECALPDKAIQMSKYMKGLFPFLGVPSPQRKKVFQSVKNELQLPSGDVLWKEIWYCYDYDEREMQYVALELCDRTKRKWGKQAIEELEKLALTKSWWDTVDGISSLAGYHFKRFPDLLQPITEKWNSSDNIWLIRLSIIFQLHYKEGVRWDLMQTYILSHIDSKEFFIQKAQGWALRQYAKQEPQRVKQFVKNHPDLSNLTKREALKHFPKD